MLLLFVYVPPGISKVLWIKFNTTISSNSWILFTPTNNNKYFGHLEHNAI